MTTYKQSPEYEEISRRLDAMLDFSTFRSDGQMRSIGKRLRTCGKKLSAEQVSLLVDVGVFDLYTKNMFELMPLLDTLNKLVPHLKDHDELVQMWSCSQFNEYMLARVCFSMMFKPETTNQIIATMALMDLKADGPPARPR